MIKFGITGGIGSGKSYVAQLLTLHWNIPVYDCDREAKRLNEESPLIREKLIHLVGDTLYDENGKLVKPLLAQFLFSSREHAAQVNNIIHPVVKEDFLLWAEKQKADIVVMESAILFESGFADQVDKILMVQAPLELRIERAMQRDGSTREQILKRIEQQDTEQYIQQAHWILQNDGKATKHLLEELSSIIKEIKDENTNP